MGIEQTLIGWTIVAIVCVPPLVYNTVRPIHHGVNILIADQWPQHRSKVGFSPMATLGDVTLKLNDWSGDWPVSSPFGKRARPCEGCSEFHRGVDLATPEGTDVFAPASENTSVRVSCHQDRKAGNIALVSADELPGTTIKLMHLAECFSGRHRQGDVIAKSGNTGESTSGPHLHVEEVNRLGKHRDPRAGVVSWLVTGKPPVAAGDIEIATLSDEDILCAISLAEGTRDEDCQPNQHYAGHIDPGNGAQNLGSFSYQHGASSPEEADALQIKKLRGAERIAIERAAAVSVSLSRFELMSYLDQFNQSEAAAIGKGGTLDRIIDARTESYIDPNTNRLDAPGLGNNFPQVKADQRRRSEAIWHSLQRRRLDTLDGR